MSCYERIRKLTEVTLKYVASLCWSVRAGGQFCALHFQDKIHRLTATLSKAEITIVEKTITFFMNLIVIDVGLCFPAAETPVAGNRHFDI